MRRAGSGAVVAALALALGACGDGCCGRGGRADPADASDDAVVTMSKEALPRCRADGPRWTVPGEDVVVGDGVVAGDAIYLGVARRVGGRRVASVARVSRDLGAHAFVDLGPSRGDDPPPRPFVGPRGEVWVAFHRSPPGDAGAARSLALEVRPLATADGGARGASLPVPNDGSLAFDVAPAGDGALVVWDEDAPGAERGVIKAQLLGAAARVVSPDGSDAETPRLVARAGGGYTLAWLARRGKVVEAGPELEGPGEAPSYRWVEVRTLNAAGEPTGEVVAVGSPSSHVRTFELVESDGAAYVLTIDDAGGRAVSRLRGGRVESVAVGDAGVTQVNAEVVATGDASAWISWADEADGVLLSPLAEGGLGLPTEEPALTGARLVVGAGDAAYALGGPGGPAELRRLACKE